MIFHGIDLHTDSFVDVSLTMDDGLEQGKEKTSKYFLDEASLERFKSQLSHEDYVIIEACTNAFWFRDQIKDLVKKCYVLDVNKYKASTNKTDKLDAKKLVKRLAFYVLTQGDQDDLPLVFVPPVEVREIRALFSTYQLNKKTITQFKNRIHSILKQNGLSIPKKELSHAKTRSKILQMPFSPAWEFQIKTLFKQIEMIEQETETLKQLIYTLGYQIFKKEIEILLSIKGFSPLTAIALMSDVVDIHRFPSAKKFCAYLRSAPKVTSSNRTTKIGATNKFSRSLSCALLSQSVDHFAKSGAYLDDFYQRMKVGKKAGVYRMAMIRKILVCAFYMLKRNKPFYWVDEELYHKKLRDFEKLVKAESKKIA